MIVVTEASGAFGSSGKLLISAIIALALALARAWGFGIGAILNRGNPYNPYNR